MRHDFDWTLEREDEEGNSVTLEISIEGTYRFGAPASWTDPAEPDEFEITAIHPKDVVLTEDEEARITDWAYENPPEPDCPEYD